MGYSVLNLPFNPQQVAAQVEWTERDSRAHPSGHEHTRKGSAPSLPSPSVHAVWVSARRAVRDTRRGAIGTDPRNARASEPGAYLPTWMGQSLRCAQRRNHGPGAPRTTDQLPTRWKPQTTWFAVDASVWPRCDAETSPDRGYYHHPYRHSHGQPIVAGWNYSWLVQVPRPLLELDRAPARATHHPGRERQRRGR